MEERKEVHRLADMLPLHLQGAAKAPWTASAVDMVEIINAIDNWSQKDQVTLMMHVGKNRMEFIQLEEAQRWAYKNSSYMAAMYRKK